MRSVPSVSATTATHFGLGLRKPHYADFVSGGVDVDFVEVISENFMVDGGKPLATLRAVRKHYAVALHGVSLSIGSAHGLDRDYLARLGTLVNDIEPMVVSDHLCWTRVPGFSSHDLLPLPYTREALDLVGTHVDMVQNALGRSIILENPSAYLGFAESEMSEGQFLDALCSQTGCGLLLDVNNVYVSASNLGFDADKALAQFPLRHVQQIHLAGHSQGQDLLIDTHDQPVCAAVGDLYATAVRGRDGLAVMIERDDNIPEIATLLSELDQARALAGCSR